MDVTIVDSEPAVVALIDSLDRLPTQPPSLYLDLEGVMLSRLGSISIIQLFVLPKNHVFLIDVFLLKDSAFCTPNRSGTTLRSILESALVPKVFFDVRNDSDALFAHFRISLQGVHDVQLLEVATRQFSKERVAGLAKCIERDAQLTPEATAVWKATKQKGQSRFAPERGGSYEVFNSRPMPQDIVDYCAQDVVYLPVLWKIYAQKISTQWMRKVEDETRERILASKEASYEPHSRDKTLSPWANPAKAERGARPDMKEAKAPGREPLTAIAQTAATEAAKKTAVTQPVAKPELQSIVEQATLRRSVKPAVVEAATKTPEFAAELGRPLPKLSLPIRIQEELEPESDRKTNSGLYPVTVHSKWTCVPCGREMQKDNKEEHLAGKQHIKSTKRTAAPQTSMVKPKTHEATAITTKNRQAGTFPTSANPRRKIPEAPKATSTKSKRTKAAVPHSQQLGLPYPPDALFLGFQGMAGPRTHQYETSWPLDYSVCDKDCGWCGHCIDGVDI